MSTLSFTVLDLDFPAGSKNKTATLVTGETDALLVDAAFTRADGHRLAAEILDCGRIQRTIAWLFQALRAPSTRPVSPGRRTRPRGRGRVCPAGSGRHRISPGPARFAVAALVATSPLVGQLGTPNQGLPPGLCGNAGLCPPEPIHR